MKRPNSNMGLYYHQLSKDIYQGGLLPRIPKSKKDWPKSWLTVDYKTYQNSHKVKLLEREDCVQDNNAEAKLLDTIMSRSSGINFGNNYKITIKDLSIIINYSIAMKDRNSVSSLRVHPSGGGRYSLEYYFLIRDSDELEPGLYHYNLKNHCLEFIHAYSKQDIPLYSSYEFVSDATVSMFVTSVFERNMRKYGERGYRYVLLEAGHVGQNIYLVCSALSLPVRAVAGTNDFLIENMLNIDGSYESLVYTIVFG